MVENVRRRLLALGAAGSACLLMAGCSVNVPDPAAPKPSSAESTLSTPTITPGHDAAAVAAKDLPLGAGGTLVPGEPVTYASRLEEVPGWSVVHSGMQGENRYAKSDGCLAVARVSVNQGPLVVPGDDVASTKALFQYLDAGVDTEKLKAATLRWGQDSGKPQRSVELLALESGSTAGGKQALVMARLFSGPESSVYVSIACPSTSALANAKADVQAQVAVVPPS
ncbi:MAG TPA: hypothetical protein VJP90_01700 [Paenarthrobacter sp.]|nr:hypothetical protein [Paenarthrobacter sp.]